MGRLRIKKKKDWRAKFRKAEASSSLDKLRLESVSPFDMAKEKLDETSSEPRHEQLTLHERNIYLLDAATNSFDLSKTNRADIWRTISEQQVRELYEVVSDLWHPKTDIAELLPSPSPELRAMYFGNLDPAYFPRNIYRFSLYADQIFIVDPFHKPHALRDEFNPLIHPDRYKSDTLRLLYFLMEAEPWIRSGIVTLIPNPGQFDFEFRNESVRLAKERTKRFQFTKEDLDENSEEGKEDFRRFIQRLPREELLQTIRQQNPGISDSKAAEVYEYLLEERRRDPLALDQTIEGPEDQITAIQVGGNLETVLALSEEIGAFPYTSLGWRWRELLSERNELSDLAKVWSPLSKTFHQLDFKFLDNVDSAFAYEMRTDGRLNSFRSFLRRTWKTVEGEADLVKIETLGKDFSDELVDEYRQAQAEWSRIDTDLVKWVGVSVAGAIASGHFSFVPPMFAAAGLGIFKLIEAHRKRKEFRSRLPPLLINHPILHHEHDLFHDLNVLERIATDCDDVGQFARGERAEGLVPAE